MTWGSDEAPAALPIGHTYAERFVQHAHILVAEGYSRLNAPEFQGESEEYISGQIVKGARAWQDDPAAPPWLDNYYINAEDPVEGAVRAGRVCKAKSRPRIDIRVESSEVKPRPVFSFEAKRFYAESGAPKYVGREGLESLLDGTKASGEAAGMLGYVQGSPLDTVIRAVEQKLEEDRSGLALDPNPMMPVWSPVLHDGRLVASYVSRHQRNGLGSIAIHHSFLSFLPAVDVPKPPDFGTPRTANSGGP